MATVDFSSLIRGSIGFDRIPLILHRSIQRNESGYPPYNIEKCGEDQYRIVLAVAGFGPGDLEIIGEQNLLTIRGHAQANEKHDYLHRGISTRSFERVFDLADYVEVTGAMMGDGLLVIDLKRELPEALKPHRITIGSVPLRRIDSKEREKAA